MAEERGLGGTNTGNGGGSKGEAGESKHQEASALGWSLLEVLDFHFEKLETDSRVVSVILYPSPL